MGFHTFDPAETDRLEDPTRFRFCSREELLQQLPTGPEPTVLDLGSGTGFYTDEIAPFVGQLYAFDLQKAMHHQYRDRGVPANVSLVTGDAEQLPFHTDCFDASISTMTFHESTTERSLAELCRVIAADGRAVFVDWSRAGRGEAGPPLEERYDADTATELLQEAGFTLPVVAERSETFMIVAEPNE